MQSGQSLCEALIIPRQPAKSSRPAKAAFDYPAAWQQYKASFGLSMFNHQQVNSMPGSLGRRIVAGISLVDEGNLDGIARHLLNGLG
jgi:hypothetical protein